MRPELSSYNHLSAGRVQETYGIDPETPLLVVSDRTSTSGHILRASIPDKGQVLTTMSMFLSDKIDFPNHMAGPADDERVPEECLGRTLAYKRLDVLPFECVACSYITGSGLIEYKENDTVCGIELPEGLVEGPKLLEPVFIPAIKVELDEHDGNVSLNAVVESLGQKRAGELRDATLHIYTQAAELAAKRGTILANTEFEFGLDSDGNLVLADEVLTPDSFRYWPADFYQGGSVSPSFDKQYVRNWLTYSKSDWKKGEGILPSALPGSIMEATCERYVEAYE